VTAGRAFFPDKKLNSRPSHHTVCLMKKLFALLFVSTLDVLVVAVSSGCSKEDAEARKVNVPAMTEALKSGDRDSRENACIELAKAGPRAAPVVPALIPLLKDNDLEIRRLAAYALGEIGPQAKAALPALKELMNDPDRRVVMQVVNSLRSIDPQGSSNLQNVNVSGQP